MALKITKEQMDTIRELASSSDKPPIPLASCRHCGNNHNKNHKVTLTDQAIELLATKGFVWRLGAGDFFFCDTCYDDYFANLSKCSWCLKFTDKNLFLVKINTAKHMISGYPPGRNFICKSCNDRYIDLITCAMCEEYASDHPVRVLIRKEMLLTIKGVEGLVAGKYSTLCPKCVDIVTDIENGEISDRVVYNDDGSASGAEKRVQCAGCAKECTDQYIPLSISNSQPRILRIRINNYWGDNRTGGFAFCHSCHTDYLEALYKCSWCKKSSAMNLVLVGTSRDLSEKIGEKMGEHIICKHCKKHNYDAWMRCDQCQGYHQYWNTKETEVDGRMVSLCRACTEVKEAGNKQAKCIWCEDAVAKGKIALNKRDIEKLHRLGYVEKDDKYLAHTIARQFDFCDDCADVINGIEASCKNCHTVIPWRKVTFFDWLKTDASLIGRKPEDISILCISCYKMISKQVNRVATVSEEKVCDWCSGSSDKLSKVIILPDSAKKLESLGLAMDIDKTDLHVCTDCKADLLNVLFPICGWCYKEKSIVFMRVNSLSADEYEKLDRTYGSLQITCHYCYEQMRKILNETLSKCQWCLKGVNRIAQVILSHSDKSRLQDLGGIEIPKLIFHTGDTIDVCERCAQDIAKAEQRVVCKRCKVSWSDVNKASWSVDSLMAMNQPLIGRNSIDVLCGKCCEKVAIEIQGIRDDAMNKCAMCPERGVGIGMSNFSSEIVKIRSAGIFYRNLPTQDIYLCKRCYQREKGILKGLLKCTLCDKERNHDMLTAVHLTASQAISVALRDTDQERYLLCTVGGCLNEIRYRLSNQRCQWCLKWYSDGNDFTFTIHQYLIWHLDKSLKRRTDLPVTGTIKVCTACNELLEQDEKKWRVAQPQQAEQALPPTFICSWCHNKSTGKASNRYLDWKDLEIIYKGKPYDAIAKTYFCCENCTTYIDNVLVAYAQAHDLNNLE